jgi:HD-GYP domain-containing protein (c-di-GMP phosphodiesterase class II)
VTLAPPQLPAEQEELVEASRKRVRSRLSSRDRVASFTLAATFLAGSFAFATTYDSHRSPSALTVCLLVFVYAVASRIKFEVGAGTVLPTELVLVPMLFLLPIELVPLYVALAILLAHAPDFVAGRMHPERAAVLILSARHALGPALVLTVVASHGPRLSDWPIYLGALGAQFAIDTLGFTLREWIVLGVSPKAELGSMATLFGVDAVLAPIGLLAALASTSGAERFLLVAPLLALLAIFAQQRRTSIDRALELGSAYRGTAFLLADVIEAEDAYTGAHSRDVVELVRATVEALGLDARVQGHAELAALLHDVGKIRLPNEVLNKRGALTPAEQALINLHTIEGEKMLSRVGGLLGEIGLIIRSCHERWDGGGYPDGLAGEEIPVIARIVACCDAYNAMTTDRPYRSALSQEHALEELRANAGTQFDPEVVSALLRVVARQEPAQVASYEGVPALASP